jgi:hypothetical protein
VRAKGCQELHRYGGTLHCGIPAFILDGMRWVVGTLILALVGHLLRRLLWKQLPKQHVPSGLAPLGTARRVTYDGFAPELEARIAMLGISLNDAFEERNAGRFDIAWRMVRLSASEWYGAEKILAGLLNTLSRHLPKAQFMVTPRNIHAHHFLSKSMVDYVRVHELLDQFVFSSHRRYQLQLRLLSRAVNIVTEEFQRTYRQAVRVGDISPEAWAEIDLGFHDFDLIAKEAVLAFQALLTCLSPDALPKLSFDLDSLLRGKVRARPVRVHNEDGFDSKESRARPN